MTFPHIYHDISRCTEHSQYAYDIPHCTSEPPGVLNIPHVLHRHYAEWILSLQNNKIKGSGGLQKVAVCFY